MPGPTSPSRKVATSKGDLSESDSTTRDPPVHLGRLRRQMRKITLGRPCGTKCDQRDTQGTARAGCRSQSKEPLRSTAMTSETSVEAQAEHDIDIHTTAGKLAELRKRSEETLHPVGQGAVDKGHEKGKLPARERIYALLDEASFVELDALARHRSTNFGLAEKRPLGDG